MNELPKRGVKRGSSPLRLLLRWLVLVVGAVAVFRSGYFLVMGLAFKQTVALPTLTAQISFTLINITAVAFIGWLLHRPICRVVARLVRRRDGQPTVLNRAFRRLVSKRMIPRYLFCLACLATLIGLFYAEENWRGKRAWEKCRRELEAKGAVLDWNAFIPPPVPDDQNIFKAPKMTEWFVKESLAAAVSGGPSKSDNTNALFSFAPAWNVKRVPVLLAEVYVVPFNGSLPPGKADAVLPLYSPAAREQAARLLRESLGPCLSDPLAGVVVQRPLDQIKPLHLVLQADTVPNSKQLAEFFPHTPVAYKVWNTSDRNDFRVVQGGSNAFRVWMEPLVYAAAECLAASQPAVPDLDVLREALERPCARMDSDYQRPFERPVPNFIRMRILAQMLSQRAQCYLLLGQPEAAWHELALVRDMCRMLEAKPANNCATLVDTMIDVAITGFYTSIIQDGLRLRVWREPELAGMQKQLMDINLLQLLHASFNAERAGSCRTFGTYPPAELKKLFFFGPHQPGLWEKLSDPVFLLVTFAPHGWLYQNLRVGAQANVILGALDIPNNQLLASEMESAASEFFAAASWGHSPFTILATRAIPNFLKATRTTARNQTMVNEACIACGLERYRLAHGQYPDSLEALVPQFAAKLPHDIIGGKPLKYHRATDGRFVLYSVGWNGKDDGGVAGKAVEEGDWVWQ
jgi:hypothetical protein